MEISETAVRIRNSLPSFYWDDPILLRIMQAWANEVDRIDDLLDRLQDGLVPALASDDLGMLAIWEHILRRPVNPPDATVEQRRGKVLAIFQTLGTASAARYVATITEAAGTDDWQLLRDEPAFFHDTLEVPFGSDSYDAGQVVDIARHQHPAHRHLVVRFMLDAPLISEMSRTIDELVEPIDGFTMEGVT